MSIIQVFPWSHPVPIVLRPVNLVFTVYLSSEGSMETNETGNKKQLFILKYLVKRFRKMGAQYNPKKFSALVIRWHFPSRIACLIFPQGKVVCTGAKSVEQANLMITYIVEEIRKIPRYCNIYVQKMRTENQVASASLPWRVKLQPFKDAHSGYCTYDPETFPGAIMRHPDLRKQNSITCLVFKSGKIVIMGAKHIDEIKHALEVIPPLVKRFGYDFKCSVDDVDVIPACGPPVLIDGMTPAKKDFKKINEDAREQLSRKRALEEEVQRQNNEKRAKAAEIEEAKMKLKLEPEAPRVRGPTENMPSFDLFSLIRANAPVVKQEPIEPPGTPLFGEEFGPDMLADEEGIDLADLEVFLETELGGE